LKSEVLTVSEYLLGDFTPLWLLRRIAGIQHNSVPQLCVGVIGECGSEVFGFLNMASFGYVTTIL
jgi:hypothetical protein